MNDKSAHPICPQCRDEIWSPLDRVYLTSQGRCWDCDYRDWEQGRLSLEEFERRERQAYEEAT